MTIKILIEDNHGEIFILDDFDILHMGDTFIEIRKVDGSESHFPWVDIKRFRMEYVRNTINYKEPPYEILEYGKIDW